MAQRTGGAQAQQTMRIERVDDEARFATLVPAWRALAGEAAEANKLMEPAMALPAWRHLEGGSGIDWLFVWRGDTLAGVFALAEKGPAFDLPFAFTELWRHRLGYLGTPLVHRRHVTGTVSAVLDWLAASEGGPRLLRLRQAGEEGPVFAAFRDALRTHGRPKMAFDAHIRAVLQSDLAGEAYLRASLGRKRLKEFRRLEKRLQDQGALTFAIETDAAEIGRAADDFLRLEQAGWKGRRGSAIAQDQASLSFFREMIAGLAAEKGVRIARLALDGRAIAVAILLVGGEAAWLWKIAFDESLARFSPGVQLVIALTATLLDRKEFRLVDSCAEPDHPMIDRIWRERIPITDALAVVRPGPVPAAAIFAVVRAARAARAAAKRAVSGLRR